MSETEIRQAIEEAKAQLDKPARGKGMLKTMAITLGLGMLSACYGAPPPRPMPSDAAQMQIQSKGAPTGSMTPESDATAKP